ncbi:hypothetical protein CPB86DRAFT_104151 [Serendipita vermifera]|nr:hypothetical protein CPB86DRAFT_104151 [Serendipita vermifera]
MSGSSRGSSEMNRKSIDRRSSLENGGRINGLDKTTAGQTSDSRSKLHSRSDSSTMEELRQQLEKMRVEKEESEANYRTLLERLSEMKSKIGLKIQQDAEELERRETVINGLTAQNDDLQNTITSLHSELSSTNAESERVTKELDVLRNTLQQQQQSSTMAHSTQISALTSEAHMLRDQLKESQELLERARLEKEEWERILMDERVSSEALRTENRTFKRESENERAKRQRFEQDLEQERQRADNLEAVLAEFEAGQDKSLANIKETYVSQIDTLTQSLAEFKSRALNAEAELQEVHGSADRVKELEKEVKEKGVLLAKVRQEAVTLNEHLIQALRRLRKFSTDPSSSSSSGNSASYVDRRLVTNILLQFLTAPRSDPKRFEMLNLLGSILGWGDEEKEKAGLQRGSGVRSPKSASGMSTPKLANSQDDDKGEESFSKMWVEFLLKEASQGSGSSGAASGLASSPSSHAHSPSIFSPSSYAPSNYAKSNYAASSVGGGGSPTQSLPPLPPLSSSGSGNGTNMRTMSGAFRLPSLSRAKTPNGS